MTPPLSAGHLDRAREDGFNRPFVAQNYDKFGCWLTMVGWTAIGQTLDVKSSFCPRSVHILSRVCPMAKKVHDLSSCCLTDVEILSKSMVFGQ